MIAAVFIAAISMAVLGASALLAAVIMTAAPQVRVRARSSEAPRLRRT